MRLPTGFHSAPQTPGAQQPKGEQTQRCAPAHVRLALAVECPCVTLGVLGRRISLASLRSALLTRAVPEHRVALTKKRKRCLRRWQRITEDHAMRTCPFRPVLSLFRQQPMALNKEAWHDQH